MKKTIAILFTLILLFSAAACGAADSENGSGGAAKASENQEQTRTEQKKHAADQYHKLLEGKNSVYYYEAKVSEFEDEWDTRPMESVVAEGKNKDGVFAMATGESELNLREIQKDGFYYTVDDSRKEYIKDKLEEYEDEIQLQYVRTAQMELDGKTWTYDEYQDEYEMEGFGEDGETIARDTYLYKKRYLVDDEGKLHAIVVLQEQQGKDGEENQLIYRQISIITKLKDKNVPKAFFEIPEDYQQVEMLNE